MRKINLVMASIIAFGSLTAQPIQDNVIIPVSVTLNSILRMNVTSGGNIEFVVNTMDQYQNGIANTDRYSTTFTVAASLDFDVDLYAETNFIGSDDATHGMTIDNLGYSIEAAGVGGTGLAGTNWNLCGASADPSTVRAVTLSTYSIIESITGNGAGDITQNKFKIKWELGTNGGGGMTTQSLMSQNLASDRYTTNIFLVLSAQ